MANRLFIGSIIVVVLVVGVVFFGFIEYAENGVTPEKQSLEDTIGESPLWLTAELVDVNTDEPFTIAQFLGKPILVESFAVWCPTCTKQQGKIKELHDIVGDSVVSISLDTDPNENIALVREHTVSHGFDWYYAIAPTAVTQSLIDNFGIAIVSAPSAPVILICPDGTLETLPSGVKSADDLQTFIERC